MSSRDYAFLIGVRRDGKTDVLDGNGNPLKPIGPKKLGEELSGKTIKKARVLPSTTYLVGSCWVQHGTSWYRC